MKICTLICRDIKSSDVRAQANNADPDQTASQPIVILKSPLVRQKVLSKCGRLQKLIGGNIEESSQCIELSRLYS